MTSYWEGRRGNFDEGSIAHELIGIMIEKKSNLCLSADVTSRKALYELIHAIGPHICVLKTHIDMLEDFGDGSVREELVRLAQVYKFLIFEDRKFCDIGSTVQHQFEGGMYAISSWSDFTNCHAVPGAGVVEGLALAPRRRCRGCLLIAQMSSAGNLCDAGYVRACTEMFRQLRRRDPAMRSFLFGYIGQSRQALLLDQEQGNDDFILMSPGVALQAGGDALGQRYRTLGQAILDDGVDVVIVGRAIYKAASLEESKQKAQEFKTLAWSLSSQR